jgi:GT2 family glycosyltransferase
MRVSVLIPTLGREKELIDTIDALDAQTILPDEIIVVDQNVPRLERVDKHLASNSRVKHLHFETKGVSLNYNRALKAAGGDIVLFLDDDVLLDPRLIEMHLRAYNKDPGLAGVAGRVEQPSGDLLPERVRVVGAYHRWSGRITARFNAVRSCEVSIVPGGNMSFRRESLLRADGFDLGFGGNGYFFETDMGLRMVEGGQRIYFEPEAALKHLMAPSGGARMADKSLHTYYYVKNGLRLFRRHSPSIALPLAVVRMTSYVVLKAAYNRKIPILVRGLWGVWDGLVQPMGITGLSSDLGLQR